MKKKIHTIIIALLIIVSITTVTVLAKTIHSNWAQQIMNNGYTDVETYSILAISILSDENVPALIEAKYDELGDWKKVAEYYDVDFEEFNAFVETQLQADKAFEIPDDIYEEMIDAGMTDDECRELARHTYNAQMDIATTWKAKQEGKTVNDLLQEQTALKNAQDQAAIDLAFGKITEKEYLEEIEKLSPDMPMSDVLEFAIETKREWMQFRKASTGVTEEEIALAEKLGMTDFFKICELKEAEQFSGLSFSEMIIEFQKGTPIDKVIADNISADNVADIKSNQNSEQR